MSPSDDIHSAGLPNDATALARLYLNRSAGRREPVHRRSRRAWTTSRSAGSRVAGIYEEHRARSGLDRLLFGQWRTWLTEGVYMKDTRVFGGAGLDAALPSPTPESAFVASLPARHARRSGRQGDCSDQGSAATCLPPSSPGQGTGSGSPSKSGSAALSANNYTIPSFLVKTSQHLRTRT